MNNLEDQAKRQLFNEDQLDIPTSYDPYRRDNILKTSNRQSQPNPNPKLITNTQQSSLSKQKQYHHNNQSQSKNTRVNLKKLLQTLENASPEKRDRKSHNAKMMTVVETAVSSAMASVLRRNSILVKTCADECLSINSVEKDRMVIGPGKKNSTTLTPKLRGPKKHQQQLRIQKLIKRKLAQKKESKQKSTAQKLLNFLQHNNRCENSIPKLQFDKMQKMEKFEKMEKHSLRGISTTINTISQTVDCKIGGGSNCYPSKFSSRKLNFLI